MVRLAVTWRRRSLVESHRSKRLIKILRVLRAELHVASDDLIVEGLLGFQIKQPGLMRQDAYR